MSEKARTSYWIDMRSFFKGIMVMRWPHEKVNYALDWLPGNPRSHTWIHLWTPAYHEGRGPYVSIGIYVGFGTLRIMRGY